MTKKDFEELYHKCMEEYSIEREKLEHTRDELKEMRRKDESDPKVIVSSIDISLIDIELQIIDLQIQKQDLLIESTNLALKALEALE